MEACDVSLSQPIEFIDTICLDKGVVLADGSATATLTTEDGETLPVTFIVSQHVLDDSNDDVKQIISSGDADIIPEAPPESLDAESTSVSLTEDGRTVYAIHFPSDSKNASSSDCIEISENGAISEDKSIVSENSVDNDILEQSDVEELHTTNLEDFMDVVTTYKCRFCRFSCHWKSGLVSHIRCCHIAEKKNYTKAEKEPNIVTARKEEKKQESSSQLKETSAHKIENVYSLNSSKESEEMDLSEDSKFPKSAESETDSEPTPKKTRMRERHIFLCGQCSDGFMTLEDCKQHMIDDHNIKLDQNMIKPLRKRGRPRTRPYSDVISDAEGSEMDSRVKETKRASRPPKNLDDDFDFSLKKKPKRDLVGDKLMRCHNNGCGHRFSTQSNLHYHYACHAAVGKTFICPECQAPYEHWRGVVMHLWKDHSIDIDLHACSECNYKTYSFFKLDNHKKIHSDERAFVCQTCGKGFKQISQLRNHLVIHLDRKNLPEKRWYSEQECDICGRKFSDTKCLRKHQQAVHSKLKPYVCSYCGHLSARKAMLELHMRQHTGEKPFVCEHCDYRTGDHNSLRRHRMRHTGAKPYKCPHCSYACIQAISYKTHLRNKHPGMEGLYSCSICTFKSVSKENFINHMSDHKREAEDTIVDDSTSVIEPEVLLEPMSSDQSPVQMQLNDNALQQLEGILPGNITAAQLIYSCLNALSQEGGTVNLPPGVTVNIPPGASNAADGTQTITIQLPSSQDMESEPYYFTIQQEGSTTALVLPSEQTDGTTVQEVTGEATDLDSVNFVEQDVSGATLDCSVLQDEESENLDATNADSLVITHMPFDDSDTFATAVIVDEDTNEES